MIKTNVLIIGGGPAGSTCAWYLRRHNVDCLVLDRETFPRVKLCAGWIPPSVIRDLEIDVAAYPHSLTAFKGLHIAIRGLKFRLPTRQYAIRRVEFDHWLLQRSGAPVQTHHVRHIERADGGYVVDGAYFGRYLIGAGGTHCPVYRTFFRDAHPRATGDLIVTQEEEFAYRYTDANCRLWFAENGLPGYAWYVPKANGYVNVGIGGKAAALKANGETIMQHWDAFVTQLDRLGLVQGYAYTPKGHSYYLRQKPRTVRVDDAFIAGDAVGLATLDMGEGIGPAVQSGVLAAKAIVHGEEYALDGIRATSLLPLWLYRLIMKPSQGFS